MPQSKEKEGEIDLFKKRNDGLLVLLMDRHGTARLLVGSAWTLRCSPWTGTARPEVLTVPCWPDRLIALGCARRKRG